jgi:hypothetical protein
MVGLLGQVATGLNATILLGYVSHCESENTENCSTSAVTLFCLGNRESCFHFWCTLRICWKFLLFSAERHIFSPRPITLAELYTLHEQGSQCRQISDNQTLPVRHCKIIIYSSAGSIPNSVADNPGRGRLHVPILLWSTTFTNWRRTNRRVTGSWKVSTVSAERCTFPTSALKVKG